MAATEDTEASRQEATDDDSTALQTDASRINAGGYLKTMNVDEVGLLVDSEPAGDGSDFDVSLEIRHSGGKMSGKFYLPPDEAEALAEKLLDHADADGSD